jgi:hypothetical protein
LEADTRKIERRLHAQPHLRASAERLLKRTAISGDTKLRPPITL